MEDNTLKEKILELFYTLIRHYDVEENDDVSIKGFKYQLMGHVAKNLGLSFKTIQDLSKTHTPVHKSIVTILTSTKDDEIKYVLAEPFVKNEKLISMLKPLTKYGINLDKLLAVDGLSGNPSIGPNFDQKHYIGNMKYGVEENSQSMFDADPEYKRLHVQLVREMYKMLGNVPVPAKQIYCILRESILETVNISLPELEFEEDEIIEDKLKKECIAFYKQRMGRENISELVKSKRIQKNRGEKRTLDEKNEKPSKKKLQ